MTTGPESGTTADDELGLGPLSPKATELLAVGPGHFTAKRESTVDIVQRQRAALAALSRDDLDDIDRLLLGLESALTGIERPRAPVDDSAQQPSLLRRLARVFVPPGPRLTSAEARDQAAQTQAAAADDETKLPPPNEVLEVARSFLVAEMSPSLDASLRDQLRRGWLDVSIEPL